MCRGGSKLSWLLQVTHHAGDDYAKMIQGDPGMEDIYHWGPDGQNVPTRGRSGKGDGVHVLTGPIYVCGAEQGDVLQVSVTPLPSERLSGDLCMHLSESERLVLLPGMAQKQRSPFPCRMSVEGHVAAV